MPDRPRAGLAMEAPRGTPPGAMPTCLRCGFPVLERPSGCKQPCGNCGFVYPLGDCSD